MRARSWADGPRGRMGEGAGAFARRRVEGGNAQVGHPLRGLGQPVATGQEGRFATRPWLVRHVATQTNDVVEAAAGQVPDAFHRNAGRPQPADLAGPRQDFGKRSGRTWRRDARARLMKRLDLGGQQPGQHPTLNAQLINSNHRRRPVALWRHARQPVG